MLLIASYSLLSYISTVFHNNDFSIHSLFTVVVEEEFTNKLRKGHMVLIMQHKIYSSVSQTVHAYTKYPWESALPKASQVKRFCKSKQNFLIWLISHQALRSCKCEFKNNNNNNKKWLNTERRRGEGWRRLIGLKEHEERDSEWSMHPITI